MEQLERLLGEYYQEQYEVLEDNEYPTEAARQAAADDVVNDYVIKIGKIFA